jgi:hypothetical protein
VQEGPVSHLLSLVCLDSGGFRCCGGRFGMVINHHQKEQVVCGVFFFFFSHWYVCTYIFEEKYHFYYQVHVSPCVWISILEISKLLVMSLGIHKNFLT